MFKHKKSLMITKSMMRLFIALLLLWIFAAIACKPEVREAVFGSGGKIMSKLGDPIPPLDTGRGIYKYTASGATPIWYRYIIDDVNWTWTPYDPAGTIDCWMPVGEIVVRDKGDGCGDQRYAGRTPAKENVEIINYLAQYNPLPGVLE